MSYDVSHLLPVEGFDPGTSVLIAGPPLTRKRELLLRLLGAPDQGQGTDEDEHEEETGAVQVTTKTGAGNLLERYRGLNDGNAADRVRVIDCVTKERGLGQVRETETTRYISSPRDLTGLSIALSGVLKRLYRDGVRTRIGIHSLSTMLMYEELSRVFHVLHVLTGQIESTGWIGGFVIDSPTERELDITSQLVDGVIETRETDEGCEFRLRGLGGRGAGWQAY
ncbi:MAG: recombinase RecA [Haloarculaceae archaeon]